MKDSIEAKFGSLYTELKELQTDVLGALEEMEREHASRIKKLETENDELRRLYDDANSKLKRIEEQLNETVQKLEEYSKESKRDVDALKLLDIYLVLMGEVFNSSVHVRLLFILHGEKDVYTLDELTRASGLRGLEVKQAVFELRNANLVTYNDETQEVRLINRFIE